MEKSKEKLKITQRKMKIQHTKSTGYSKSGTKREVSSNTGVPRETRKILNNLTLYLKELEKEKERNPKVIKRKEIIKIRVEINGIETKKTIRRINETKSSFSEKIKFTNP